MTTEPHSRPSHEDLALAREFAHRFRVRVGRETFRISLFGSRARGDADAESDLDLFVALDSDDPQDRVKDIALDIARDLTLERGVLVSAFVADRRFLESHQGFSFIDTVEAEGVRV
jgi:predicted nucleotidyltransferase